VTIDEDDGTTEARVPCFRLALRPLSP